MSSASRIQHFLEEAGVQKIKPSGENLIGLCPFHQDNHRSFSMNVTTGQYICFSEACGESGGLLSFLINACDYSYKRARKEAERFGVVLERSKYDDVSLDFPEWRSRRMGVQSPLLQEKLLGLYDFCPRYLVDRMFDRAFLKAWEVGYDFETEKVVLPVRDAGGSLVGITKRATDGSFPKYLHLKFKKSNFLYGENRQGDWVRGQMVWCGEGHLDAIAIRQMKVRNVVSTMGSRVSGVQIKRLGKLARKHGGIVLAYDNDSDGVSATKRIGDELLETGERNVFVAAAYPDGFKDPGDLLEMGTWGQMQTFFADVERYDRWRLDN